MKGVGLVTISALFFATYGIWSKLMVGAFGEFNQAIVKSVILLSLILPYANFSKSFRRIKKHDLKWFIVLGLMGGLNQAPYYYAFERLTVGTATLLFYTGLTFGAYILGKIFFREEINNSKKTAFILAFIGLMIIYRFEIEQSQLLAALSAFIAGIMGSAAVVYSKKLSGVYSELQIITSYLLVMIVVNPIFSLLASEPLPSITYFIPWLAQFGYAISYMLANLTVVAGFKYLDPSIGAIIGLLEVIFAALFGIIIFGEAITLQFISGSILIIFAISLNDLKNLKLAGRR